MVRAVDGLETKGPDEVLGNLAHHNVADVFALTAALQYGRPLG